MKCPKCGAEIEVRTSTKLKLVKTQEQKGNPKLKKAKARKE